MADTKISDLPAATAVNALDVLPIVQSGTTKKATANLFIGTTTPGSVSTIDLGIISAADVYAAGGYIELLPAVVGRIIISIVFLADNRVQDSDSQLIFTMGNDDNNTSGQNRGLALFGGTGKLTMDTIGVAGDSGVAIGDNGPLGVVAEAVSSLLGRIIPWTANTKYAYNDLVLGNGHLKAAGQTSSQGGTSGSSEPAWVDDDDTNDGTIVWAEMADMSSGWTSTIHAVAQVITIPGLDIPYPATLEFVQQPTDVVAGIAFDPIVRVKILDQNGDPFTGQSVFLKLSVLGAGELNTSQPQSVQQDLTTGIVTFTDIGMSEETTPGAYQIVVMINDGVLHSTYYRLNSDPFDVTAP